MRIFPLLILFSFLWPAAAGLATPPTSINLTYDLSKGNLHIQAVHPTFDLNKSYVRLVVIYVNDAQVSSIDYFRQNDYNEFDADVPLTAEVGDVIKADLFCTLGGEMAQEMTVKKTGQ